MIYKAPKSQKKSLYSAEMQKRGGHLKLQNSLFATDALSAFCATYGVI